MSYFTAVLAQSDDEYRALDYDVRDAGVADVVVEREDEWFALVRLTAADEVKVFLSDVHAVADSPFAELFVDYLDSQDDEYEADEDAYPADGEEADGDDDAAEDEVEEVPMLDLEDDAEWSGDADIFADLGVPAEELVEQSRTHASDPARVVAHVGEEAGFADRLEAAR